MSADLQVSETQAIDLARECLYRFLAAALSDPRGASFPLALDAESQQLAFLAADLLREEAGETPRPVGFGELPAEALTLPALCAHLHKPMADLRAEHDRTFGLLAARDCPPYETEYHPNSEPFFRSQQLADIAGFYRAFGLDTAHALPERQDHLALELEFMAFVLMKKRLALAEADHDPEKAEHARVCDEVERSFFRDHLVWWVPSFAAGLRRKAGAGFYAALAKVLAAFMFIERGHLRVEVLPLPFQPLEPPEEQAGCGGCTIHARV